MPTICPLEDKKNNPINCFCNFFFILNCVLIKVNQEVNQHSCQILETVRIFQYLGAVEKPSKLPKVSEYIYYRNLFLHEWYYYTIYDLHMSIDQD